MMKAILKAITIAVLSISTTASAQRITFSKTANGPSDRPETVIEKMDRLGIFNKIELAANIGTTGLGLEVASPMTEWAKLRVGFDCMPNFKIPMNFAMANYVDGKVNDKFDRISEMMYKLSGMTIDQEIKMESKPTMTTFRLLVDVYPFKNNRHWHFTAGFFVGGNSIGTSMNTITEMPSLLALNMYDRLYRGVTADDFLERVYDDPHFLYDLTGLKALDDVYLDPMAAEELQQNLLSMGRLGVHVGDFKDGTPYLMMPDKDGTVSAKAKVNRFRPYLGFGYGGALSDDGKWQASFDAGVQFWGGAPKVTTHDGTVLNDLIDLRGKIGTYMGFMKAIPVYPTIDFRISYTF